MPRAYADTANACRVIDIDFLPSDQLQLVVWIEDAAGNYVDTVFITQTTGTYGMGNRPGELEFNSAPLWPYGRRENTFPVWSHRHGMMFPRVEFQDGQEMDLSHSFDQSSSEQHYCRPEMPDEAIWDTGTCASTVFSDKGHFSGNDMSLYPPRTDVIPTVSVDSPSVAMYKSLNPFDAESQATPPGGVPFSIAWPIPGDLPAGNYVVFVEAAKEFDDNATYNATSYPAPTNISYANYGKPYRGQPSVVYSVPFAVGVGEVSATTMTYAGYGDPDGQDGALRTPDSTIDTDTPGSGGARLTLAMGDNSTMYRVRVSGHTGDAGNPPDAVTEAKVSTVDQKSATLTFVAPGVTAGGVTGKVSGYEIRVRADEPITAANFESSTAIPTTVQPDDPGQVQSFEIDGLLPLTTYYVGIRAYDDCKNDSALTVVEVSTADRISGEVDACFIATAAYGSLMANDVEMLRHFRDAMLHTNVLGEMVTEAYYTFGPAVADVIGESDVLRTTTRSALSPVVRWVGGLSVTER